MFRFKKKQHLNEMAKASEGRMIDRLPAKKQAIYLTGKALEKMGDNARLNPFKQFIVGNGMDWDAYKAAISSANLTFPTENTTWTASRNGFASDFHSRYNVLYANMKRMIEVSKDDIDRDYVDKIKTYYNMVRNEHVDPADAYEQTDLQTAIDWIKDDPEEAEERFGSFWPVVQRHLSRWLDSDYENSLSNLMDQFWDWRRANQRNPDNRTPLDTELATKLANKLVSNVAEFGQYYNYVLTTVVDTLGVTNLPHSLASKLTHDYVDNGEEAARNTYGNMFARVKKYVQKLFDIDTESDALPTAEEVEAFDRRGNGTGDAAAEEDQLNGFERYVVGSTVPERLKEAIQFVIENNSDEEIWSNNTGAVNRDQVRKIYAYIPELNSRYHRGRRVAFEPQTLQEFYDSLKPVFLAGFTTNAIKAMLALYANKLMESYDAEDNQYWSTQTNDTEDDFNESVKVYEKARMMFEAQELDPRTSQDEMYPEEEHLAGGDIAYELSELLSDDEFNIDINSHENGRFYVYVTSIEYPDLADLLISGKGQTIESACLHQIVDDEDKEININSTNIKDIADIAYNYIGTDITDIDRL